VGLIGEKTRGRKSRDTVPLRGLMMIPVGRWDICVLPLEGFKFIKCRFLFKFLK
jgi:hypothetical protein